MTIRIHDRSTVEAQGIHNNGNCKAIYNATKNKFYTSTIDAAEDLGVTKSSVSWALTGRSKKCKGNVLIPVSKMTEHLAEITEIQRAKEEASKAYREKAEAYDAYLAWKEEVRNIRDVIAQYEARSKELYAELIEIDALAEEARKTLAKLIEEELR